MESIFILLHSADDNKPITVNISQIEQIYTSSKSGNTVIVFIYNDDDIVVNESVERVFNIINSAIEKNFKMKNMINMGNVPQIQNNQNKQINS